MNFWDELLTYSVFQIVGHNSGEVLKLPKGEVTDST